MLEADTSQGRSRRLDGANPPACCGPRSRVAGGKMETLGSWTNPHPLAGLSWAKFNWHMQR
jgi:hypothetical protein